VCSPDRLAPASATPQRRSGCLPSLADNNDYCTDTLIFFLHLHMHLCAGIDHTLMGIELLACRSRVFFRPSSRGLTAAMLAHFVDPNPVAQPR
jgi:hypothetical protein